VNGSSLVMVTSVVVGTGTAIFARLKLNHMCLLTFMFLLSTPLFPHYSIIYSLLHYLLFPCQIRVLWQWY